MDRNSDEKNSGEKNMDKNSVEIPKELTTFEQKNDYTHNQFEREHDVLNELDVSGAKQLVICGQWLNRSKEVCKEHKMGNWKTYFEKRFPHLEVRTAQRCMKVARQANLEESPALACLGKTALYKLTSFAGKRDLASYLSSCGYDVKIDPNDKEAIEDLKGQLDEYIDFCESLSPSEPRYFKCDKGQKDKEKDNETKANSKPGNTNIMDKLNRSATSFMKNADMVLNDTKTFKSYQDELAEIIKEVEEKLAALEEFMKTPKSKK
jgi:hypothetical protein